MLLQNLVKLGVINIKGKTRDAFEMRGFLDKSGVHYSIEPELPYWNQRLRTGGS